MKGSEMTMNMYNYHLKLVCEHLGKTEEHVEGVVLETSYGHAVIKVCEMLDNLAERLAREGQAVTHCDLHISQKSQSRKLELESVQNLACINR